MTIARLNPASCWQQLGLDTLWQRSRKIVVAVVATLVLLLVTTVGMMTMAMMFVPVVPGLWVIMIVGSWLIIVIVPARDIIVPVIPIGDCAADDCYRSDTAQNLEQIVVRSACWRGCQPGNGYGCR